MNKYFHNHYIYSSFQFKNSNIDSGIETIVKLRVMLDVKMGSKVWDICQEIMPFLQNKALLSTNPSFKVSNDTMFADTK